MVFGAAAAGKLFGDLGIAHGGGAGQPYGLYG